MNDSEKTACSDEQICQIIMHNLSKDNYINEIRIYVDVTNGIVTLTGEVDSLVEKRAADDAASNVFGVKDTKNHLTVKSTAHGDQSAIKGAAAGEGTFTTGKPIPKRFD